MILVGTVLLVFSADALWLISRQGLLDPFKVQVSIPYNPLNEGTSENSRACRMLAPVYVSGLLADPRLLRYFPLPFALACDMFSDILLLTQCHVYLTAYFVPDCPCLQNFLVKKSRKM